MLALLLLGCGARTTLSVGSDAAVGPTDAGRRDAGRDAGRQDAGPPPPCGPGSPRVLARDARFEVEVDERFVYYTDASFGGTIHIRRVPKCGGVSETLFDGRLVSEILLRDGHLYFVTDRGVERMRTDGSERTILHEVGKYSVGPISVGGGFVFFSDPAGAPETLRAVSTGGGAPFEVLPSGGFAIYSDETRVYLESYGRGAGGDLIGAPFFGGPTRTYAPVREVIRDLAADATHLYWADSADDREAEIFRTPIDGSGPVEVVFRGPGLPLRLAVGTRFLYFTDHTGGRVVRVPLGGGPLEVLDDDVPVAEDIALDEESVFAVSFRAAELIKIVRPR